MPLHDFSRDFIKTCIPEQDAFARLCHLCDSVGPRLSATESEKKAVDLFTSHGNELGYKTNTQTFSYDAWKFGSSSVSVATGTTTVKLASNPLGWSPRQTVSAPMVDAGYGVDEELRHIDLSGNIALVSNGVGAGQKGVHRSVKYASAVAAGAAGFLFYPGKPGGMVPMGSINLDARTGSIPAAGISYEDAMALRRAKTPVIEISVDCATEASNSYNGICYKPGSGSGEVVVCGHIDTWNCPGAVDNGSGIAAMMELARLLAPLSLKRGVRFIAFGSEELGLHGSKHYVANRDDLSEIYAVLNLDCVAIREGTLGVSTQDTPLFHQFWETLENELNVEFILSRETTLYSDHHPFRDEGVPAAALLSRGGGGFGFAHTAYDTLDKLDRRAFTIPLLISGVAIIELAMSDMGDFRG